MSGMVGEEWGRWRERRSAAVSKSISEVLSGQVVRAFASFCGSDTLVALVSATLHDAKRQECRFYVSATLHDAKRQECRFYVSGNLARCKATGVSLLRFWRGLDREIGELLRGVERLCLGRLGAVFAPKGYHN
jgi:hypothetical protein